MKKNELTKSQKGVIAICGIYELLVLMLASGTGAGIVGFVLLSFPYILYWIGVWIWGFGYIFRTIKHIFNFIKKLELKSLFFDYKGRIGRGKYFLSLLAILLIEMTADKMGWFIALVVLALTSFSKFSLISKRCNDCGKNSLVYSLFMAFGMIAQEIRSEFTETTLGGLMVFVGLVGILGVCAGLVLLCSASIKQAKTQQNNFLVLHPVWFSFLFIVTDIVLFILLTALLS